MSGFILRVLTPTQSEAPYHVSESQLCYLPAEFHVYGVEWIGGRLGTRTKCYLSFNIFVSVLFYEYFILKKSLVCACQKIKVSRICHLAKKRRKSIRAPHQGEKRKIQPQEHESGTWKHFILPKWHPQLAAEPLPHHPGPRRSTVSQQLKPLSCSRDLGCLFAQTFSKSGLCVETSCVCLANEKMSIERETSHYQLPRELLQIPGSKSGAKRARRQS